MPLSSAKEKRLSRIAVDRAYATADDEEEWSFLFNTIGSIGDVYMPWSEVEDLEFDPVEYGYSNLDWTEARKAALADGSVEPTKEEIEEWRIGQCYWLAEHSDGSWASWITPLVVDGEVEGYALFLCHPEADRSPDLEGVYETADEARLALESEGAVVKIRSE